MQIVFRDYEPEKDLEAAIRIWKEVGWLDKGDEEAFGWYMEGSRGMMADVDGTPECYVLMTDGAIRYLDVDLPLNAVTGVTTGRVARRLGIARRLLARAMAAEARRGAAVSALGVFEQGFYDALGYGTGTYSYRASLDPSQLRTTRRPRVPVRLGADDWQDVHAARLARRRVHGSCNLLPPGITRMEMSDREKGFGMGYRDGPDDALTHYVWCHAEHMERGPYSAELAFRTADQMDELLALLKTLADQVVLVRLREPPGVMMQDWLNRPFRHMSLTEDGKHEVKMTAAAYWQVRIMDLAACLAGTHLVGPSVTFNLALSDPFERFGQEAGWSGIGGDHVVTLGPESLCRPGSDSDLPTLRASVNAFSRMWLGVRPATGLAMTDDLAGPDDLLHRLDEVLRLPEPQPDWDF